MTGYYRSEEIGAELRVRELLELREEEAAVAAERWGPLYARRVARAAAGAGWTLGFLVMAVEAACTYLNDHSVRHATPLLFVAWTLGLTAYLGGYAWAHLWLRGALYCPFARGPSLRDDAARLEATMPDREARAWVDAQERRSVALPMMGFSLLMPLTLHWAVFSFVSLYMGRLDDLLRSEGFGWWIGLSLVLVGHCHAVLVLLCWRFARRVRSLSLEALSTASDGGWTALGWVVLSSLPLAMLYMVPTLLVAMTGMMVIPLLFAVMRRKVLAERMVLADQH